MYQTGQKHRLISTRVVHLLIDFFFRNILYLGPGRVAQSVTCLATDACLTADPGVASSDEPMRPPFKLRNYKC